MLPRISDEEIKNEIVKLGFNEVWKSNQEG